MLRHFRDHDSRQGRRGVRRRQRVDLARTIMDQGHLAPNEDEICRARGRHHRAGVAEKLLIRTRETDRDLAALPRDRHGRTQARGRSVAGTGLERHAQQRLNVHLHQVGASPSARGSPQNPVRGRRHHRVEGDDIPEGDHVGTGRRAFLVVPDVRAVIVAVRADFTARTDIPIGHAPHSCLVHDQTRPLLCGSEFRCGGDV